MHFFAAGFIFIIFHAVSLAQELPSQTAALVENFLQAPAAAAPVKIFTPQVGRQNGPPHYFLPHRELARRRVGLALSGGGARGLFQIGILQALEEHGVAIDFIAGTSMGSVIGGLYAAGYNAKQLREIVQQIPWSEITVDAPPRTNLFLAQRQERERAFLQLRFRNGRPYIPPAIAAGQKLLNVLTEHTMRANYRASAGFDRLRIPFRAMATDMYSGKEVIIADGDLAEAMRASMAVPILFAPVPRGEMLLADGGLVNNIPADVVRRYVDVVIAADATSSLRDKAHLNSPWEIADQLSTIMQREQNEKQRRQADVVITLGEPGRNSSDFAKIDSLVELGYRRTLEQMKTILELSQPMKAATRHDQEAYPVHFVTLNHAERLIWSAAITNGAISLPQILSTQLSFPLPPLAIQTSANHSGNGTAINAAAIQNWVSAVYRTGQFAAVRAELRSDSLALIVQENPRFQQIHLIGNTIYPDSTLLACMRSRAGEAINHQRSSADLVALVERYRSDGYALAEIREVAFDHDAKTLHIKIDEGKIGAIEIEGLQRTQKIVVLREFPQKPGDIFNSNFCSRGINNIHSTGLFDQVHLNIKRGDQGAVVKIKVQEKPFKILRLGGRYDNERDLRGFIEAGDENAFGTGSKIFVYQEIGERDFLSRLVFRNDRLLRTYISFSAQAYRHLRENFVYQNLQRAAVGEYRDERWGLNFALGQQMRRFGAVSAEFRLEEVTIKELSGESYTPGNSTLNAITLRSILDTRDRLPFPRRGRFVHAFYEQVYADLGEKDSFFRFLLRMETFHSRGPHTFHSRINLSTADQTTPFSEQFRAGGAEEVYGLREQEFIGRHAAIGSMGYRYKIRRKPISALYLGVRYDLSGLWIDKRDTNYRKFHHAVGVSLSGETPLGPISIAYGRYENLRDRVYMNWGYSF